MKFEYRSDWTRHHRRTPSTTPMERWGHNGSAVGRASSTFGENPKVQRAAEEVGLKLRPPPRYRSILVPVTGDPFGEHALPLALGIARRAGAEVRVVHVHCPWKSPYWPDQVDLKSGWDVSPRQRLLIYLNDLCRRLRKVTSVPVTPVYLQGREVADSLCEAAKVGTDLVVMATHGRGPLGRFWFGSVADELMRQLSVPLLLVRGYDAPADLTGDPLLRNILIPLDGSEVAEQVLEPALALGTLTSADHTLLRLIPSVTDYSLAFPGSGTQGPQADGQQTQAWNYLRRVADRVGGRTLRVHPRLVLDEDPTARAILRYARTHDADLIALATRGRGGLARLFRGSVADQVVRDSSVPVLVFRPDVEQVDR